MIYIDEKIINKLLNIETVVETVENAYIALRNNQVELPNRQFMPTNNGGDLLLGGSYIKNSGYFGAKLSAYNPENIKENKPVLHDIYTLFNDNDGSIACIIEAEKLTAIRTGAKTAVVCKYLARKNSKTLGILGMGNIALPHLQAIIKSTNTKNVIAWSRDLQKHKEFIDYASKIKSINFKTSSIEDIVKNSDILINLTSTPTPLFNSSLIKPGTLVIGINHSPKVQEYDTKLFKRVNKVFVDFIQNTDSGTIQNAINSGYLNSKDIIEMKNFVGTEKFRISKDEIYYFQSGGTSIEDLAGAIALYKEYIKANN